MKKRTLPEGDLNPSNSPSMAAALQAEVAAYIDDHAEEVDEHGHRLVVRNGYHQPREVTTSAGAAAAGQ